MAKGIRVNGSDAFVDYEYRDGAGTWTVWMGGHKPGKGSTLNEAARKYALNLEVYWERVRVRHVVREWAEWNAYCCNTGLGFDLFENQPQPKGHGDDE